MKKEHIQNISGKDFAKFEGLLDEAHNQGLTRVSTTLIQTPNDENGNTTIVAAEVETAKGTFSAIGDASPANVGRMIVPHAIRMAETRAIARALRWATNFGVAALEELSESEDTHTPAPRAETQPTRQTAPPANHADANLDSLRRTLKEQLADLTERRKKPFPDTAAWIAASIGYQGQFDDAHESTLRQALTRVAEEIAKRNPVGAQA